MKHEPFNLPNIITKHILTLMKTWKLKFAAIDMIVTPSGEYVFLEVNPNGQWGWIETLTGMPITDSLVELLLNPR